MFVECTEHACCSQDRFSRTLRLTTKPLANQKPFLFLRFIYTDWIILKLPKGISSLAQRKKTNTVNRKQAATKTTNIKNKSSTLRF